MDFNKIPGEVYCRSFLKFTACVKINWLRFTLPITLVRDTLSANYITLLSSKGICKSVDLQEILFIIIHTLEFGVLLDFNKFRCEDNCLSFSFPKTLVRAAVCAY